MLISRPLDAAPEAPSWLAAAASAIAHEPTGVASSPEPYESLSIRIPPLDTNASPVM
jgi:hypothetical protein